jgi:hypothetical protein
MVNAQHLSRAEVDAVRGLQQGASPVPATDPIWHELASAGLVELRARRGAARADTWSLTMRGRFYRTD